MAEQHRRICVMPSGELRFIYDDQLAAALPPGQITRASHVEPWSQLSHEARSWIRRFKPEAADQPGWYSDLLPVTGEHGLVLGPFPTREQALREETSWLNANMSRLEVGS